MSWPNKAVAFSEHNPRWRVVKSQMAFDSKRHLDPIALIALRNVCDGKDCHDHSAVLDALRFQNDDTGTVLRTFFPAFAMLTMPKRSYS